MRTLDEQMLNRIIKWQRAGIREDVTIWIDVAKLDAAWKLDRKFYVGLHGHGDRKTIPSVGKYQRFGRWIRLRRDPVEMPHVGTRQRRVLFTNGRHRFAWCRDSGVRALPVTTSPEDAFKIRRLFGTPIRKSEFYWRNKPPRFLRPWASRRN